MLLRESICIREYTGNFDSRLEDRIEEILLKYFDLAQTSISPNLLWAERSYRCFHSTTTEILQLMVGVQGPCARLRLSWSDRSHK